MLSCLRWIVFLPAAFLAAGLAGLLMKFVGGFFISEYIGLTLSGASSGIVFICVGLYVAPKRNDLIKWLLTAIFALCGIAATIGSALGDDKLRMAVGISMLVCSVVLALVPANEIMKIIMDSKDQST